jgi:tetratricopeptide (TPR) repeat protein
VISTALIVLAVAWTITYITRVSVRTAAELRIANENQDRSGSRQDKVKGQLEQTRAAFEKYGGPVLAMLLADRLTVCAGYFPEQADTQLDEAIRLNRAVLDSDPADFAAFDYDKVMNMIAYELAWEYFSAGLYREFTEWKDETLSRAPYLRENLLCLQASASILSDDQAGLEALIQAESQGREGSIYTPGILANAYLSRGDFGQAITQLRDSELMDGADANIQTAYASCLLAQEDFHTAAQVLRQRISDSGQDAETDQDLLVPMIGLHPSLTPEVMEVAARSAKSSRNPRSEVGSIALALAQLYYCTLDPVWLDRLSVLADRETGDFTVQSALAIAMLNAEDAQVFPAARSGRNWRGPAQIVGCLDQSIRAERLANSVPRRQQASLLMARAIAHSAHQSLSASEAEAALAFLAKALAAAAADEKGAGTPIPQYDAFLLDWHVRELRTKNPAFDEAVHRLVLDFMERRSARFADALGVPIGSFGERPPKKLKLPGSIEFKS